MKIAIISDTHLGYSRFEEDSYINAYQAFKIAKERADLIVMPGDVFDSNKPGEHIISKVFEILQIFRDAESNAEIKEIKDIVKHGNRILKYPIITMPGTHEYKSNYMGPLDVLEKAGYTLNMNAGYCVVKKDSEELALYFMKGVPELVAKDALKKLNFKPIMKNSILFLHQSFKELLPYDDEMVASLEFADLPFGFSLYVNGHIHKRKVFNLEQSLFLIPGSTIVTQIKKKELLDKRAFIIYDTVTKDYEFVEIPIQRDFFFLEHDVNDNIYDALDSVMKKLSTKKITINDKEYILKPFIKIRLKGKIESYEEKEYDFSSYDAIIDIDKSFELIDAKIKSISLSDEKDIAINEAEKLFYENLKNNSFSGSFDFEKAMSFFKEKKVEEFLDYIN